MSTGKVTVTATGATAGIKKKPFENYETVTVVPTPGATPYTGLSFTLEASVDGTNYEQIYATDNKSGIAVTGGTSISPSDGTARTYSIPLVQNYADVRVNVSAITGGSADFICNGAAIQGNTLVTNVAGTTGAFTNLTASGTLAVTGASTLSSTLAVTGNVSVNTNKVVLTASNGNIASAGSILSSSATGGIGYATGAGGAVTQGTSRTTGVTVNTPTGTITLFSAAGSATPATFTVTNSSVAATDTVIVSQKSGTDAYSATVSAVGAGSFKITIADLTGTTTEAPAFNFAVVKGVAA